MGFLEAKTDLRVSTLWPASLDEHEAPRANLAGCFLAWTGLWAGDELGSGMQSSMEAVGMGGAWKTGMPAMSLGEEDSISADASETSEGCSEKRDSVVVDPDRVMDSTGLLRGEV
jgi:hypothetical protein